MAKKIPAATVSRLPIYARALLSLSARDILVASSEMLATESHINAAQIRKDLSHIGCNGTRGLGYDVPKLLSQINRELGLNREWRVALVGFGKLGAALVGYKGFAERGFTLAAVFDRDPAKVGQKVGEVAVEDVSAIAHSISGRHVDIAMIATPAEAAQSAADALVAGGIRSILNFAPVALELPKGVSLRNVDLSIELQVLSFYHYNRDVGAGESEAKEAAREAETSNDDRDGSSLAKARPSRL